MAMIVMKVMIKMIATIVTISISSATRCSRVLVQFRHLNCQLAGYIVDPQDTRP